jgi:membrane-associated protease RseP (regulator of RpoE activity)
MRIKKAWIPLRTRDGREWSGGAPDPYAVVLVGGKELFRTPIQPHTHEPTWPDAPKANYRIGKGSKLTIELWDDATFQQRPICTKDAEDLRTAVSVGSVTLVCDVGAKITLEVEPARAKYGLGMWYELRSQAVYVTRVLAESPAGRAALREGQRILSIQGKEVSSLDDGQVRSLINANARTGLVITVLEPSGKTRTAQLREGPVYPLVDEDVDLD